MIVSDFSNQSLLSGGRESYGAGNMIWRILPEMADEPRFGGRQQKGSKRCSALIRNARREVFSFDQMSLWTSKLS